MNSQPVYSTRTDQLVVQDVGDDLLIYDQLLDTAHCLSEAAAQVWRCCKGGATADAIAVQFAAQGASNDEALEMAEAAISELAEKQLLVASNATAELISRRHALRRLAGVGAAAVAAPLIVSAAVPKSAEAHGSPPTCAQNGQACTPANTANTANNCCTSTGAFCTYQSICSTTCVQPGVVIKNATCASGHNASCCTNNCVQNGGSGNLTCS
jgi:hypothetical protein